MTKQNVSKLTLGTAKFGNLYGIGNITGKPSESEASGISNDYRFNT